MRPQLNFRHGKHAALRLSSSAGPAVICAGRKMARPYPATPMRERTTKDKGVSLREM